MMKETKLTEVYCRPKTEEEWKIFGLWENNYCLYAGSVGDKPQLSDGNWVEGSRTEVTVQQFIDLLHDRITPWRLEEIGFMSDGSDAVIFVLKLPHDKIIEEVFPREMYEQFGTHQVLCRGTNYRGIETFTELKQLIKSLTPKE